MQKSVVFTNKPLDERGIVILNGASREESMGEATGLNMDFSPTRITTTKPINWQVSFIGLRPQNDPQAECGKNKLACFYC